MSDSSNVNNRGSIETKKNSLRAKQIKSNAGVISKKVGKTRSNKWSFNQINNSDVNKIVRAMSPIDDFFYNNSKSRKIKINNKSSLCHQSDYSVDNRIKIPINANDMQNNLLEKDNGAKCDSRLQQSSGQTSLKSESKTNTKNAMFRCTDCGLSLSTRASLIRHRSRFHQNEQTVQTLNCEKSLTTDAKSESRKTTVHRKDKMFMCEQCGKQFSVKANLVVHLRIHKGEKPYICNVCGQCFTHPNSLVGHTRIHTGEKPYICTHCGKGYRVKHQLSSHLIVHSDVRPFKCEICPKTFRSRSNLRVHRDQHQGIKRFACSYCNRKFLVRGNMLKHIRRHVGHRPHRCDSCGKAFIEKQELRNHLKTHGFLPNTNKHKKTKSNSNQTNSTTITTTSASATTEGIPNTTTVSLTTLTSSNTSITSLLPIVSYFTPQHLSGQHSARNEDQMMIPTTQPVTSTSETEIVFEEIPIENLTFATLIRPQIHEQHFCDDSHQLLSVRTDSFINSNNNSNNNNFQTLQKCSYDQNDKQINNLDINETGAQNSELKNCRLCKQGFVDIRQHLIDYHKVIFNEFDDYLHFTF